MKSNVDYDVIIIGGGPAGLTAGINCGRSKLKTLIIEEDRVGGAANESYFIGNYPGFPKGIKGSDLMNQFYLQAVEAHLEFAFEEVTALSHEGNVVKVHVKNKVYHSYGVIIATGGSPRKLGIATEEDYIGKGISFCTLCDAPEAVGKKVLVIGTGDSAIDQSIYLLNFTDNITIVSINHEGDFDCSDKEKLHLLDKVTLLWNREIIAFEGEEMLQKVILKDRTTEEVLCFECDYCFEFIGFSPKSSLVKGFLETDDQGAIITNERMETSSPGIYAVGDVRQKQVKQLTTATSDGAIAAAMMSKYLKSLQTL